MRIKTKKELSLITIFLTIIVIAFIFKNNLFSITGTTYVPKLPASVYQATLYSGGAGGSYVNSPNLTDASAINYPTGLYLLNGFSFTGTTYMYNVTYCQETYYPLICPPTNIWLYIANSTTKADKSTIYNAYDSFVSEMPAINSQISYYTCNQTTGTTENGGAYCNTATGLELSSLQEELQILQQGASYELSLYNSYTTTSTTSTSTTITTIPQSPPPPPTGNWFSNFIQSILSFFKVLFG